MSDIVEFDYMRDFLMRAYQRHKDAYLYDKFVYVNADTLAIIICPVHGEFKQYPTDHIAGYGCEACEADEVKRRLNYRRKPTHN